jgi:hypothetical protein
MFSYDGKEYGSLFQVLMKGTEHILESLGEGSDLRKRADPTSRLKGV